VGGQGGGGKGGCHGGEGAAPEALLRIERVLQGGRIGAEEFFLLDRDVHQSLKQLVTYHVIFIDTTSVKIIFCIKIVNSGVIAQPLSDDLY
jgi:hypothetical protein